MSANTSIKEGGTPFPFGPVRAILVEGSDGKYDPWVPESERQLGYKSIDKNGIYRASDDGVYGWGSVSVSVSQATSVTGRDPDTGEEVVVRPDPETGDIVKTVVPTEIRVIEPPTNPYGIYVDGQTISTEGMVVKAYDAQGNEMLTVPVAEISLNPDRAAYDPDTDIGIEYSDDMVVSPWPNPFKGTSKIDVWVGDRLWIQTRYAFTGRAAALKQNDTTSGVTLIGASESYEKIGEIISGPESESPYIQDIYPNNTYTLNGKMVRYVAYGIGYPHDQIDGYINDRAGGTAQQDADAIAAWTMIYGHASQPGSPQTITVSWPRPEDGAILETTFDIIVQQSFGGASGGGGQAGETGAGRND